MEPDLSNCDSFTVSYSGDSHGVHPDFAQEEITVRARLGDGKDHVLATQYFKNDSEKGIRFLASCFEMLGYPAACMKQKSGRWQRDPKSICPKFTEY